MFYLALSFCLLEASCKNYGSDLRDNLYKYAVY